MSDGLVLVRGVRSSPPPLSALTQPELPTAGTLVGLDFETRGLNAADPNFIVVGAGVSWINEEGNYVARYVGTRDELYSKSFLDNIATYQCVAHNQLFDGAALEHLHITLGYTNQYPWSYCTYGLYRQLASEGHAGQRWGLKQAEVELLGWPESNERELYDWLIANGYRKGKGADAGQMWRAPAEILGPYCCLDAVATLQLYNDVLNPVLEQFPQLRAYHQREFLNENYLLIRQLFDGVYVDREQLAAYQESLIYEIDQANYNFRSIPSVACCLAEYNKAQVAKIEAKEPAQYRKDGKESKNWINWKQRVDDARTVDHFNINSNRQLQWLFYNKLGYTVRLRTDSGQPAVNTKALGLFGNIGKRLREYNEFAKERGYVDAVLDRLVSADTLHLQFRNPGTLTERLAGTGGINVQQVPKTQGYMQCWKARPGRVWLHSDVDALEQVVLAELSCDPTLMKLYGPNSSPHHDVYLFNGAHITGLKENILKYYDPDNPTAEGKKQAKAYCKRERSISKVITLASSYGAGIRKILETLQLSGVDTNWEEVERIYHAYWQLYAGVREYGAKLEREWIDRNGWVYNGVARPKTVAPQYTKDLVNRVVQSTGHDILMMLLYYTRVRLEATGLPHWWIIADWHDEYILECDETDAAILAEQCRLAYDDLNLELGGTIPITGGVDVTTNLWEAKTI